MRHLVFVVAGVMILATVVVTIPDVASAGLRLTAYSGTYMWYSGRGMNLNNTMSQQFPVPAGGATLTFMTWYDIEPGKDYGYVEVYDGNGAGWARMEGNFTSRHHPFDSSPADGGITGKSGGWVLAVVDLSAYAGHTVLLRFRYETDGSVNHAGWAIDDIAISEIGFFDDVETGYDGWSRQGWDVVDGFYKTKTKSQQFGPSSVPPADRIGR